jgi:hypothetical protein
LRPIILDQQYLTLEALLDGKEKDGLSHSKLNLLFVDRNGAMIETECSMQFKLHSGASMLLIRIEPVPAKSLVSKLAIDPNPTTLNHNQKPSFQILQFNAATKTVFGLSRFSPEEDKITDLEGLLGPIFSSELAKLHLDKDFMKNKHKMIGPFRFTRALIEREYQTKVSVAAMSSPKKDEPLNKCIYIVEVWCPEQISQGQMAAILGGGTSQRNISSMRLMDLHETTDNVFSYDLANNTNIIGSREDNTASRFQVEEGRGEQAHPSGESNLIEIIENSNSKVIEQIEQEQLKQEGNRPEQNFDEGVVTKYLSLTGHIRERPDWLQSEEDEVAPPIGGEAEGEGPATNSAAGVFGNPGGRLQGLLAAQRDGHSKIDKEPRKNGEAEIDANFTSGSMVCLNLGALNEELGALNIKKGDISKESAREKPSLDQSQGGQGIFDAATGSVNTKELQKRLSKTNLPSSLWYQLMIFLSRLVFHQFLIFR